MRKIPFCMATQHPDNAKAPYWSKESAFIDTRKEVEEAYLCFSDLKIPEYMWDWEGKHVDESVTERLLEKHLIFFMENQLGKDSFLTFRVPNPWEEGGYKLARAFVNIISSNDLSDKFNLHSPPIFEAILPMTKNAQQLFWMRKKYCQLAKAIAKTELHPLNDHLTGPADVEWIPLVETTSSMTTASGIFSKYVDLCKKAKLSPISYLRPFIARSDPALNSGFVAATLSAVHCLSECEKFSEETNIPVFPIIGVGSLPFRGGLTPYEIDDFLEQYCGVTTPTIQSAYRYDYPKKAVNLSIEKLSKLRVKPAKIHSKTTSKNSLRLIRIFDKNYRQTLEQITDLVNLVSKFVPSRRERKQHIGLFGYSRMVGKTALPRAISFTASFYSIGIPPEIIGMGKSIQEAKEQGLYSELDELMPSLQNSFSKTLPFVNCSNLNYLASKTKWQAAFKSIKSDLSSIEDNFAIDSEPKSVFHQQHLELTRQILHLVIKNSKYATDKIEQAAIARKSIG